MWSTWCTPRRERQAEVQPDQPAVPALRSFRANFLRQYKEQKHPQPDRTEEESQEVSSAQAPPMSLAEFGAEEDR